MHQAVQTPQFASELVQVGTIPRANEAIAGLIWALSSKPDDFPVLPETSHLRLAKSEKLLTKPGRYAVVYVWFKMAGSNKIDLLSVEAVPVPLVPYLM
jgi:hypothetical protein